MAEYVNVAVDAMGGDNAPAEIVKGAVEAVNADKRVKVFLVGKEPVIREELKAYTYDAEQLEVVHAEEVIETAEPPVMAIRRKKDSSIVKAMYMVKNGECDAFVSAGSTGAVLVGGQVIVGRIRGVERPPLAPLIPTEKGVSLLLDCGANVDARPSMLVQFAKMGSVYMESVMGVKNPRVGIVNIGAEEEKGNALVKETFPLLKNCPEINFIGSVELPEEEVPILQKMIIGKVYEAGKQVITATQMLDSMMKNPRPTRAEVADVANAIYDGTSAIMLSGETAAGKYPVESVQTMVRIANRTEADIDYEKRFYHRGRHEKPDVTEAVCHATCTTAYDLNASAIVAVTKSGRTARMISRYRPAPLRQFLCRSGSAPRVNRAENRYSSTVLCTTLASAAANSPR